MQLPVNILLDVAVLSNVTTFDWRWSDKGSGAQMNGGFWHPISPDSRHFKPLGSVAVSGYQDINGQVPVILVGDNPSSRPEGKDWPAVASPMHYELVWDDKGSGAENDGSIWRPVAPHGYVCVGDVVANGYHRPSHDAIWCLRNDLVFDGSYDSPVIWSNAGSGVQRDTSIWGVNDQPRHPRIKVPAPDNYHPTFRCSKTHAEPDLHLAKYLGFYQA
ncbi:hypothetical protein B0H67DRAFT_595246 [Lasiosphaeris hirsuta]|uniref:Uncharacterized protein n=1 Tax=Lasiosphaeris hirsuta TaxID=260670 RepID=A0AA39ZR56_9PEZI|nr:hypothetical protein B0H67DRAFT_595246 [Lasiosphaeris hirsuta]